MAVVLIQQMPENFRAEMYDATSSRMGLESDPPAGMISHAAGCDEAGQWRVVDIWESREAYDRFVEGQLGPAIRDTMTEMGMNPDDLPDTEKLFFDIHDLQIPGVQPAAH
jgi:hypothetical protein